MSPQEFRMGCAASQLLLLPFPGDMSLACRPHALVALLAMLCRILECMILE